MFLSLPRLGVGVGYRGELHDGIASHATDVEWLEIITEHYIDTPPERLMLAQELRRTFPLIPHGIEMSIGTPGELDESYLAAVTDFVAAIDAPWFSDHLCYTRAGGVALGDLTPLPRTREMASTVAAKAQQAQNAVGAPFLLENITYYVDIPAELSEAEFISLVMEQCECGLLLDLTNVYTNAVNHGFDAIDFLDSLPLERVVQIHVAGGVWNGQVLIDSHDHPVPEQVWSLLGHVVERAPVKGVLLERDSRFPADFSDITGELARAREIWSHAQPSSAAG
jgi:uncharacterized protein (UPF0276 family)